MRSESRDPAGVDEQHPVGELDRGDTVRDNEGGDLERLVQTGEDLGLDHRVDRGGGVVEYQHAGLAHERACQRNALTLSA